MKKVLIVDDESENIEFLSAVLAREFEPITASSGKDGIAKAIQLAPHVIVLDVNMPGMDGFEVCAKLKSQPVTRGIPVIMLTTASNVDSRIKGLDLGADDYICKPFHARELLARVRARVRQHECQDQAEAEIEIGNLVMDPKTQLVSIGGEETKLTQLEFVLLRYFLERKNLVIQRAKLLGDLWPDSVVTGRTVDAHVSNLRRKIKNFSYPLTTIYKAGYILKTQ
jgi:DNA-binding response OmpR family regulator